MCGRWRLARLPVVMPSCWNIESTSSSETEAPSARSKSSRDTIKSPSTSKRSKTTRTRASSSGPVTAPRVAARNSLYESCPLVSKSSWSKRRERA